MKGIATIAIASSLLAGSCVPSPPHALPTTHAADSIERSSELVETITQSAIATSTPRPPTPTMPINTVTSAAPTFTITAIPEPVTLDCSPAIHLIKLGVSNKPQAPIDLAVNDRHAYVLDREGLWVMDVSDYSDPIDVGFIPMLETKQVIVEGGYAFGIDARGLWVLDLLNPIAPELIGFKDTPFVSLELSINNGFAYVRDDHGILHIFDLANPTSITEVGVYDPPGQILGQEIYGNTIFILRELANANLLPSFSFAGEYIYVADLDGGLWVIEISDPTSPSEIGSSSIQVSDVEVVGEHAYIFEIDELLTINLWVAGISTSIALVDPTHLGIVQLERSMTTRGLCSFISEIYRLLLESEMSHPGIAEINPKDFIAPLKGVDIVSDVIYVADEEEGFVILQMIRVEE